MEKKIEDVLEILQKTFDCADLEGNYLTEEQLEIINGIESIKEYLEQELDKAREEGRRDYARELLDDYYQPGSDSITVDVSEIQSELSKLKQ